MRQIIGYFDFAIAAFNPAAVRPEGLSTKTIRESSAAKSVAIASVRSLDGPSAKITSNPPS